MIILGIESSCDDTAAAVIENGKVVSSVVSSQDLLHQRFGGVVPELASRRHMEAVTVVVEEALKQAGFSLAQIELICVTQGPGLIGSLLVGFSYAKSLSFTLGIPFVGVDHMAGHLLSAFLEKDVPDFPFIALIVSGGTTALFKVDDYLEFTLLGATRDDAAGEAFDKISRYLKLGYPGGPHVSRHAEYGDPAFLKLPRAWLEEGSLDFSFSGLKTSVLNHCNTLRMSETLTDQRIDDVCASFQQAVVEVLVEKAIQAARIYDLETIVLGGGVSANRILREQMTIGCSEKGITLCLPAIENCTDNAAMIAFAGSKMFEFGVRGNFDDDVFSRSHLGR